MVEDVSQYLGCKAETTSSTITNHYAVRIQSGCLRQCGFCKKHYMNMPIVSKPIEQVLREVEQVIQNGYTELMFLAENSTEYGIDLGYRLIDLLKELDKYPEIKRIFLSALCIDELTVMPELVNYIANNKKIEAVQIEIQSLIPAVRKNMRLTSTREEVLEILQRFSSKAITTNIMVGYPGEEQKNFEEQLRILKENKLYYVQINRFDPTPKTPGYEMEPISRIIVEKRLKQLTNTITALKREKAMELINSSKDGVTGVAINSHTVKLDNEGIYINIGENTSLTPGNEYKVRVTGIQQLFGGKEQNMSMKGILLHERV